MGRTLQIYFFTQVLRSIVFFSIGVGVIAMLVDFTEVSNRTGNLPQYRWTIALALSVMRIPYIIQVALPFIVLFATMTTLMMLNRKYELVVARSIGVSALQFLMPGMAASLLVGVFAVTVMNPLAANGFAKAHEIEGEWRSKKSKLLITESRPWLRQPKEDGGLILIGASRVSNREKTVLFDAVFLDIEPEGTIDRRLDARRATLSENQWMLRDVEVSRPGRETETSDRMIVPTTLNRAVIQEALVPPEMIPFFALNKQIEAARSFGVAAGPLRMQYHSLLATPALLLAMTLIAATVSLRFVRFGQSFGVILTGIGAGFMLYVVTAMTKSFGGAGMIPPVLAAWLPIMVAGLFGAAYLLHREDG